MRSILLAVVAAIFFATPIFSQKTVFWPNEWNNPGDDFYNRLSYDRSYQSENFVIFWGDLVGANPASYSDPAKRFNPVSVADTLEKIYDRFITELEYVSDDPSTNLGKYKIIIVMLGTFTPPERNGFAYGGSYSNTIGAMWVDPSATRDGGALSHELVHSLQNMHRIQENPNPGGGFVNFEPAGFFYEGHANYMRTLMYQWMANTDVPRWLATRSFHWSSTRHHYANFHLMYYVQEMDGFQMMTRLWKESIRNEHPLVTLRRLKGLNQNGLNDYLWGYAKKQATFDYLSNGRDEVVPVNNFGTVIRSEIDRIKSWNPRYLWKQYTILNKVDGASNRYVVNDDWAPQDYGVNVIRLHPTCDQADKKVFIKFKGHTEVNPNFAGWRYGFVTSKPDGTVSRYSEMYDDDEGEISFELLANEAEMFLVVMGAPKEHTSYVWEPGYPRIKRYPYELAIENAFPEGHQDPADFRSTWKTNGHLHSNGGGWVSNSASVAGSVYVGPYAMVRSGNISGNVRIEGHAWVEGATVRDNVIIRGNACIFRGTYSGSAIVEGNAFVENGGANTNALVTGNVFAFGPTYGGSVVMGGDSENGSCSNSGVYLQFPHGNNGRNDCDGQGASHWSNQDVNPTYSLFTNQQMTFTESTACDAISTDCAGVIGGTAYLDNCGKCIGGTTGQQSDDADNDGSIDCEDECPNDPNKTAAGLCGCGVVDNSCVSDEVYTYNISMDPMTDYTATTIQLDGNAIAGTFNMTQQELINAFGNTVTYAGVESNETLNPNSTANAPGHWYDQNGNTISWGDNAYIYAELNINTMTVNVGQYPNRVQAGDSYTVKQALVYNVGGSVVQATLEYNVTINGQTVTDTDNDGIPDNEDACPNDPNKAATAGICGCGNVDEDTDNDGICDSEDYDFDNDGFSFDVDCNDGDPNIGLATVWYADTDNDGAGDASQTQTSCTQPQGYVSNAGDNCPGDGTKLEPGECGCGIPEEDCTVTGDECDAPMFSETTAYSTPYTKVIYEGKLYQNKWYAYGIFPSGGDPWQLIGFCGATPLNCGGKPSWNSALVYSASGTEVIYEGNLYANQWYTQGQSPGQNEVWRYLGPCTDGTAKYSSTLTSMDIYPNPTQGQVYLNQKVAWKLYNTVGEKVEEGTGDYINLSQQKAGLYMIEVKGQFYKVIKR